MPSDALPLPGQVQLAWATIERHPRAEELALLSEEERERLETFGHAGRRAEFVAGRAAARRLLSARLQIPPRAVPLAIASDGAVDVLEADLHLSIAHSGGQAVAAVAPHPVGVDVEVIQPRHAELYRYILHESEYASVRALPLDHDATQVLCWTLKEAVLKGRRTGFRCSPQNLRLDIEWEARRARVNVRGRTPWHVAFAKTAGSFFAVAVPEAVTPVDAPGRSEPPGG